MIIDDKNEDKSMILKPAVISLYKIIYKLKNNTDQIKSATDE